MAGAGNPAGRRPRPFAGRDRSGLRRRRPLVARRREGGRVAQQGYQRNRGNRWHGLDPAARRTGSRTHQTRGVNRFPLPRRTVRLRPSSRAVLRSWTSSSPNASGMMYQPHGSPSITPRTRLRSMHCGIRCASRCQDCSREPRDIAFISAVTGAGLDTSILDGDYWFANLRQPVLFEQAVWWAYEHGYRTFIESSPHPVLTVGIRGIAGGPRRRPQRGRDASTQRRRHAPIPVVGCRGPRTRENAELCDYFRRCRRASHRPAHVCLRPEALLDGPHVRLRRHTRSRHHRRRAPLLGAVVAQADTGEIILTGRLSLASHPWLADHKVNGVVLVPGAVMVELALHAGDHAGCPRVDQLVLHAPMIVGEHGGVAVQVVVGAWRGACERPVRIYSRTDRDDLAWTRHAEGVLSSTPDATPNEDFEHWPSSPSRRRSTRRQPLWSPTPRAGRMPN